MAVHILRLRDVPIHPRGTQRRDEWIVLVVVFLPSGIGVFCSICRVPLPNFIGVLLSVPFSHCVVLLLVVSPPVLVDLSDLGTTGPVVLVTLLLDLVMVFLPMFLLLLNYLLQGFVLYMVVMEMHFFA